MSLNTMYKGGIVLFTTCARFYQNIEMIRSMQNSRDVITRVVLHLFVSGSAHDDIFLSLKIVNNLYIQCRP